MDKLKRLTTRFSQFLNREVVFKTALITPMQLLLTFLLMPPFAIVIYLAFVKWQPILSSWTDAPFIGIQNFAKLFTEPRFYEALARTLVIVVVAVGLEFSLGLGLALLFSKPFRGKSIFTSVILYPMMLPWVVVGFIFYLLFLDHGPVNYALAALFGSGAMVSWLRNPTPAISAIILGDVWQWTPFMFLIFYSGLGALPKEPREAAMTLGASSWQIFRYITLPMLKPIVYVAVVIRALECFKIFDLVYIMTGGGPGVSTESLSLYIYRVAFKYGQLSYAAALALVVLIAISVITRIAVRPLLKEEAT